MTTVRLKICGIPAQAEITSYRHGDLGRAHGPPEYCYPPVPEEATFHILDRKGYPAPWLEDKAAREGIDLHQEVLDSLHNEQEDDL